MERWLLLIIQSLGDGGGSTDGVRVMAANPLMETALDCAGRSRLKV